MNLSRIRSDLADWRVSTRVALFLFLTPLAITAALALLRTIDREFAFSLVEEDRLIEWATVAGFATAAVFGALAGAASRRRVPALAFFVFAAGCLLVAGEEISWGQRILDFGTPESLRDVNTQDQTTVHNVDSLEEPSKAVLLLIGLYGSVGAWILRSFFMPPLFLSSSFLVLAVIQFAIAVGVDDPPHNQFYGETAEFTLSFGLAAFALLNWRRLRAAPTTPSRLPSSGDGAPA